MRAENGTHVPLIAFEWSRKAESMTDVKQLLEVAMKRHANALAKTLYEQMGAALRANKQFLEDALTLITSGTSSCRPP